MLGSQMAEEEEIGTTGFKKMEQVDRMTHDSLAMGNRRQWWSGMTTKLLP